MDKTLLLHLDMSLKFSQKSVPELDVYGIPLTITDSSTFFNQIPLEVKASIPLLKSTEFDLNTIITCVNRIVDQIGGKLITDTQFIEFQKSLDIHDSDKFGILFNGLYSIVSTIIQNKVNLNVAKSDLLKINIYPEVVDSIQTVLCNNRIPLEIAAKSNNKASLPKLSNFRWRIDVTTSNSHLTKIMRPSILIQV